MITRDDIKGSAKRIAHLRFAGGFAHMYQVDAFPRLSYMDRSDRKTRTTTRTWHVDGNACKDLDEALARLNTPVDLTLEETAAIAVVPDEWTDADTVRRAVGAIHFPDESGGYQRKAGFALMFDLSRKGLIEYNDGQTRRTREKAA